MITHKKYKKVKSKQRTLKHTHNTIKHNRSKNINILSYNISWESMSGNVKSWALCSNNTNENHPKHYSVCVNNIANVITSKEKDLDFITLQEATDFQKLIEVSPSLKMKKMKYEIHKSGLDTMVTFWIPKYKLLYSIKGEFENGRPWLATLFNTSRYKICLINVHMGHYTKNEEYVKLETMLSTIKEEIKKKENMNKKSIPIRYIISGDFNYDIKQFGEKNNTNNTININDTHFYYHPKKILTCCINRKKHNDHIIDSLYKPIDINIPDVNYMASDHKPIIVNLVK